uniref:Uncharacterized protein n=1 Tax=viral metagenome TaxID=1070528 RepID=A0A6C0I9B7_9ZZZZ
MSQNRAVAAAQRRRAGGPEPAPPGRGPQPSINSSQMFAQGQQGQQQGQIRPGTSGRLAGQQAQLQQQQMQQQMKQQMQEPKDQGLASVNRMTLAQAITLITLRLGKVETLLHEREMSQFSNPGLDSGIIDVIMSRLEALESAPQTSSNATSSSSNANSLEVAALKQNVDLLKNTLGQYKTNITVLSSEQKNLRQEVESLKAELAAIQNLTMENNQQITQLSLSINLDADTNVDNVDSGDGIVLEDAYQAEEDVNEIGVTDLKTLIEQELNN